jgi:hypothetical protein
MITVDAEDETIDNPYMIKLTTKDRLSGAD